MSALVSQICERVWEGRIKMLDLGIRSGHTHQAIHIVVGDRFWKALEEESERMNALHNYYTPATPRDPEPPKIFGLPVILDSSLGEDEIRFRQEVNL